MSPAQCQLLNEVVLSSQPQEGAASNAIRVGDYDLNVSGKDYRLNYAYLWWGM